ncbi:fibronectin type III domain-containing protein [Lysobacter sp. CFH 32150]|uniref:fibronectin type III domain-containing protein n=1 Tax=Lysobacter sp. CFH 32150 TaxID=2927128 RepID=UPI001FA73C27|nr:fibronectin type III domain-containing protein [Lysobacter sp. CFH 32150]MCI4567068.1 fibronectin type III domain-containing protein [Lysobacter sp. CFH 32150]
MITIPVRRKSVAAPDLPQLPRGVDADSRRPGRRWTQPIVGLAAAVTLLASFAALPQGGGKPIQFSKARILIELNDTAQDAGIQMLIDGEGWEALEVIGPNGRGTMLEIEASSSVGLIGVTELFFESAEPSLQDLPLEDLLVLFPAGKYLIEGRTVEGQRMVGTTVLSHDIPAGPHVVTPTAGGITDHNNTVIDWDPVADPPGGKIGGYQVIVELPEPLRIFSVDLPATVTAVKVPAQFLQPGTDYKFEVLAVTKSHNQTITESTFSTAP